MKFTRKIEDEEYIIDIHEDSLNMQGNPYVDMKKTSLAINVTYSTVSGKAVNPNHANELQHYVREFMINTDTYTGPSFTLRNRIKRLIWGCVYVLFFRYSPKPFHAWRSFLLRLFGATVGKGVHVYPAVKIWAPWNLELGDECGIGNGAILYSQDKISIGYRVVISQGTHICAGTHDYRKPGFPSPTISQFFSEKPSIILF